MEPTIPPTTYPTTDPTAPTPKPTAIPTPKPTDTTSAPTLSPTPLPTPFPTNLPTHSPTTDPTVYPSMEEPDDCAFWEVGPINISYNNVIGSVSLHDVVNVSLELKTTVGWTCPINEYCNVFAIGEEHESHPKLPSVYLRKNAEDNMKIRVIATVNDTAKQQMQFGNSDFRSSFNDGMYPLHLNLFF